MYAAAVLIDAFVEPLGDGVLIGEVGVCCVTDDWG
jgi:hypothetical protein